MATSERPLLVFDADDTLWAVQPLYESVIDEIATSLTRLGLSAVAWREALRAIDVQRVAALGYSVARFPESCVLAYENVVRAARLSPDPAFAAGVRHLAASVFTTQACTDANAKEVLAALRDRFFLALLTQGDPLVQRQRIRNSGLAAYFDGVHIVDRKGPAEFRSVLQNHRSDAAKAWSIGNSLRSDIKPALACGMKAIWVCHSTWEYENLINPASVGPCIRVSSLIEVLRVLREASPELASTGV